MADSVIVYGPQGCGKTRNARRIARALGLKRIVDGFSFDDRRFDKQDTLLLTNEEPPAHARRAMSYDDAMRRVRARAEGSN
jgi:cytidylate kinase